MCLEVDGVLAGAPAHQPSPSRPSPAPSPGAEQAQERQAVRQQCGPPRAAGRVRSRVGSQCPDRKWLRGAALPSISGPRACRLLSPPQARAEDRVSVAMMGSTRLPRVPGQSVWGILQAAGRTPVPRPVTPHTVETGVGGGHGGLRARLWLRT